MIRLTKYPDTIAATMNAQFSWDVGTDNLTFINTDDLYLKNGSERTLLYSNTHPNAPGEKYSVDTEPTINEIRGDPQTIDLIVLHSFNGINSEYVTITYSRQSKGTYYIRKVSPTMQGSPAR